MNGEDTEREDGASEEEVAETTPTGGSGASPQAAPEKSSKIDLTSIPEFRTVQSKHDREMAEMRQQLAGLRASQQQREAAEFDTLDDAEKAARLQKRIREMEAETQQRAQAERFTGELSRLLAEHELPFNDPRIAPVLAVTQPDEAGMRTVMAAIAKIERDEARKLREELDAERKAGEEKARKAAKKAERETLANSGALVTSAASGATSRGAEKAAQVMAFKAEWAKVLKSSDEAGRRAFNQKMRAAGLTFRDLGY